MAKDVYLNDFICDVFSFCKSSLFFIAIWLSLVASYIGGSISFVIPASLSELEKIEGNMRRANTESYMEFRRLRPQEIPRCSPASPRKTCPSLLFSLD